MAIKDYPILELMLFWKRVEDYTYAMYIFFIEFEDYT